jgi:UPF0716 protein FxsA
VIFRLLLLFIVVPLIELWILLYLADVTSWQFTLGLVIVTGVIGSLLARSQGWRTWRRIQQELAQGQVPATSLVDALMIFVAGALLLTPGILTDLFGLSLLIPLCRRFYRRRLVDWFRAHFTIQQVGPGRWQATSGRSRVIDSYVVDPPQDKSPTESPEPDRLEEEGRE